MNTQNKINLRTVDIGSLIKDRVDELGVEVPRICNFLKCTENEVKQMYQCKSIDSEVLLRWSKLLDYDFFRIYSQHLILYSPPASNNYNNTTNGTSKLPQFRKNIYTKEVIDFVLELASSGEKTKQQIVDEYKIPKTTLYKWIDKYKK
ncbi:helix-turn-helix domain-containing protein [Chryseobacterium sp. BLS98]|jgi:hypothetical protein|uniref:helix-turn-helix domain-containing protein n=1 Tax=Chryseobacterium sp. BLS98 TaxID=885586 RepID=UPI000AF03B83|nr:helix-turn-helix domain-containing protein [Chryseobacterium sp. BLS98]